MVVCSCAAGALARRLLHAHAAMLPCCHALAGLEAGKSWHETLWLCVACNHKVILRTVLSRLKLTDPETKVSLESAFNDAFLGNKMELCQAISVLGPRPLLCCTRAFADSSFHDGVDVSRGLMEAAGRVASRGRVLLLRERHSHRALVLVANFTG